MSNSHDGSSQDEVMQQLKALGYIDPGAGSSMLQIVLGGFFRFSGAVKSFFRKIFGLKPSEKIED